MFILEWNYRKNNIESLLTSLHKKIDIYCLQEIEEYDVFYKPLFEKFGCDGIYYSKGQNRDGLAIFYKSDQFTLLDHEKIYFVEKETQFFVVCHFHDIATGNTFYVINTHLKSKKPYESKRTEQGAMMVDYIKKNLNANLPLIICGDFNADPYEPVIKNFNKHFESVYDFDDKHFTTFKIRDKVYKRYIDYIWINKKFNIMVEIRPEKFIKNDTLASETGLPTAYYPSDHLIIGTSLSISWL